MSPEQAKGRAADRRSDIWAFGCVLYETLTGTRAFEGDDVSDTLAAVLRGDPDWTALPAATPASMHRLLRRCLVKDVRKRWQAVGDLRVEIEAVLTDPRGIEIQAAPLTTPQPAWKIAALVLLGTVVGSAMTAGVLWRLRPSIPAAKITRFSFALADGQFTRTGRSLVAVSPDGASVVYVANNQLYLRRMEDLEPRPILGTNEDVSNPFFSPDGQWVGFWSARDRTLKKIAISGGAAVLLCAADNPLGATWEGDTIVFGQAGAGILAVSATGGNPEMWVKTSPGETAASPQILPGGNTVLFTVTKATGTNRWDSADIAVSSRETGERKVLIHGGSAARYVSTGHILYAVGANLLAVPFERERLEVTGGPVPIAEGVMRAPGPGPDTAANFGVSRDGTFIYVPGAAAGGATPRTLVWVDRQGHEEPLGAEPQPYAVPRISPDGTRVVAQVENAVNTHIVVYELSRKSLQRLTFDKTSAYRPTWAPDGRSVYFRSDQDGGGVYRKASDGTGASERVTSVTGDGSPNDVSADGKTLVFSNVNPSTGRDQWIVDLTREGTARPLLVEPGDQAAAVISPDGRWVAYSDEPGGAVYVRPFPNVAAGRWQVSSANSKWPLWSPDGRELFYVSGRALMAAAIDPTPQTFKWANAKVLFEGLYSGFPGPTGPRNYDVSRDGRRFLMIKEDTRAQSAASQIIVVQNWTEELKRLVPSK